MIQELEGTLEDKHQALQVYIKELGGVLVAFSGGVDSSLLAVVAYQVLGDKALAFTLDSPTSPRGEVAMARRVAEEIGIRHRVLYVDELTNAAFARNDVERCYICKKSRFEALCQWAENKGIAWVLDGSNADDKDDYRPGMKAIGELPMTKSPLLDLGITKAEVRLLARRLGLSVWNKPSAPCLATRIPYGQPLTEENLSQVGRGEQWLHNYLRDSFRVRWHDNLVRLEVSARDRMCLLQSPLYDEVLRYFHDLGFQYVTIDMENFYSGSQNKILEEVTNDVSDV